MTNAAKVIDIKNLKIWFPIVKGILRKVVGNVKAVNNANLNISEGETLGIVGESGSGKTTLALAIMRLISSEGHITFMDKKLDGLTNKQLKPIRRDIQMVFQDPYGRTLSGPSQSALQRRAEFWRCRSGQMWSGADSTAPLTADQGGVESESELSLLVP